MGKGILRDLEQAEKKVDAEITANARGGGHIARGLSAEGFAGGYQAALRDVRGALTGFPPYDSRYWPRHE